MNTLIAGHSCNAFLKPGKLIISSNPVLVSTILGSCVAVTMYSPSKKVGAICHAMLPNNPENHDNLLYVETAVRNLYDKMSGYGGKDDMVVKLFGGAQVLANGGYREDKKTVGEQNVSQAQKTLKELGLSITSTDIGGTQGRKLFFSIKTGAVYLRKLKPRNDADSQLAAA